jgi:signal transduction histidine kinase
MCGMDSVAGPPPGLGARGRWILLGAILLVGVTAAVATGLLIANGSAVPSGSAHEVEQTVANRFLMAEKIVAALLFATAGWYLSTRRPRSALGPLVLLGAFANAVAVLALQWAVYVLVNGHHGSAATTAVWVGEWALAVEPFVILGLYLLFPDGHRARGRLGALSLLAVVLCGLGVVAAAFSAPDVDPNGPFAGARDPVALASATDLAFLLPVAVLLGNLALVLRWIASRGDDRRCYRSLSVVAIIGFLLPLLPFDLVAGQVLYEAHTLLLLLVVMAAALRDRVFGIEVVLNRTLVYVILTGVTAGVYGAMVVIFAALGVAQTGVGAVTATVVAAFCLLPARLVVQRGVNRFLYGRRDEPYAVVTTIASELEAAGTPEESLEGLLTALVDELRVPGAELELLGPDGSTEVIAHGDVVEDPYRFAMAYRGEHIGDLVVARRAGQAALAPQERDLLEQIARQAAVAAEMVALTRQLQRSRERIVGAAEEERRRLRRDLHEGLGPGLTAAAARIDACIELVFRDQARVAEILTDVRSDLTDSLAELRRVVYALRPPVLDELGLLGAVREHVSRSGVPVVLDTPPTLPPLPAAVEITAFRIVSEAVANVARHARATRCTASVAVTDRLVVDVRDDGPETAAWRPGVGLSSMRERVAELGGSWYAGPADDGGGVVHADLPLSISGVVS